MENCKVVNIPEKRFLQERGGWGQGGRTFTDVPGNRVSDHYPRNMYIKVPLKIGFLDIKNSYFTKTNLFENTYNKCGAGLQLGTYFTHSFIF